jgi:hypothetical protein
MICPHCQIAGGLLPFPVIGDEEPTFVCSICKAMGIPRSMVEAYNRHYRVPVRPGRPSRAAQERIVDYLDGTKIEMLCPHAQDPPELTLNEAYAKFYRWQHEHGIEWRVDSA